MTGLGITYALAGLMFAGLAGLALARRRWANGAFWALLATSFLAGDRVGNMGNGLLVVGLAAVAASGRLRAPLECAASSELRAAGAKRHGDRLFIPALIIPLAVLAGSVLLPRLGLGGALLADPKQAPLLALAAGAALAAVVAMTWLRPPGRAPLEEGMRLADGVGWALVLPQALAALGGVFALAGVGGAVGGLVQRVLPGHAPIAAVLVYSLGMALSTMAMGNAFAAFPVMMGAIGLPVLVRGLGGDPAPIAAIGMLCGFCGTLLTPMAANFNLVPTRLLELPGRWSVIRIQAPTALILLAFNLLLLELVAFR